MTLFTVDIDWAPEPVIEDTLALFETHGVHATLFATHKSPVVAGCNRDLFEVAIHPNFNRLLAGECGDPARIVDDLLELYPDATGARSHSAAQSGPILDLLHSRGMRYDSNIWLPYWRDLRPIRLWNGMLRIPFNWTDDVHVAYARSFADVGLDPGASLNVVDFHPIHVFINTESADRYASARPHYHDAARLRQLRNDTGPGARTALIAMLEEQRTQTLTMATFAAAQPA